MDYEPGRPTAEDLFFLRVVELVTFILVVVNVAGPAFFALRRRFGIAGGLVLAWFTSPSVYWWSVA